MKFAFVLECCIFFVIFSYCFFQVYWLIKLFCIEPWAMILARAVAGIPCSACYIVLPIYLKEISDIDLRGALGSLLIMNRYVFASIMTSLRIFLDVLLYCLSFRPLCLSFPIPFLFTFFFNL